VTATHSSWRPTAQRSSSPSEQARWRELGHPRCATGTG
jgi:hypothetical protein